MLRQSCKRIFPVMRNQPLPRNTPLFARAIFAQRANGVTVPVDRISNRISDCTPTSQRLDRTKTPDPNREAREAKSPQAKMDKSRSGIQRGDGEFRMGRDSRPAVITGVCLLMLSWPLIGMVFNDRGTSNGGYQMNPILARQRDVKQEYGKGGGGFGIGPSGADYQQRAPELGFNDKSRSRTLAVGQPQVKTEVN